ncbi:hypothetical protein [Phenylobacterium sp.]|uniref:CC_3452 family protein n=1 Tax=Phenylobacterium sp. TaxID=1871053 RepID=UPI002728F413|nr:hypothetical protein [Phenylobacterium sp.]MDO8799355.1 hypothetical protein [Phenylobacterium sp.]
MKLHTLSAACAAVITLSFAGGAFAAEPVTAKLTAPVAAKTKFIAGGAVFLCEADACVASAPSSQTFATSTCKAVAKNVGAIASFGVGGKTLDADKLSACNTSAASGTQMAGR